PSRENSTPCAEIPERNGTNCRERGSKRTSSPRGLAPTTKSRPSRLGQGQSKLNGPCVSRTGSRTPRESQVVPSRRTQMSFALPKPPEAEKTKYFPSGVHRPEPAGRPKAGRSG